MSEPSPDRTPVPASDNVAEERDQRAAQRDFIDSRIAELEEEIRRLKSDRNELTEIARLPPEILSQVFIHYQQFCTSAPWWHGEVWRFDWTEVTHVSRFWRSTALGCRTLWSDIDTCLNAPWAVAMFERSKQSPISFRFSERSASSKPEVADIIRKVFSQLHRLKGLNIDGYDDFVCQQLEQLTSPTPILECLQLRAPTTRPHTLWLGGSERPMLRKLKLEGYKLPSWTAPSPMFPALISLKVTLPLRLEAGDSVPSAQDFFQGIEAMPNLRELYLEATTPVPPLATPRRVTRLPKLELFRIDAYSFREFEYVLRHLVLPSPSLSSKFELSNLSEDPPATVAIAAFGEAMSRTLSPVYRSLTVQYNGRRGGATIQCHSTAMEHHDGRTAIDQPPDLTMNLRYSRVVDCGKLLAALPLNDVLTLDLDIDRNPEIFEALSHLPSVHTISLERHHTSQGFFRYICNNHALDLLQSESQPSDNSVPSDSSSKQNFKARARGNLPRLKHFASLKRLVVKSADFGKIDIESFLDWLMFRYELGGEIEELQFNGCLKLYKDDVQRIGEVVASVTWDGVWVVRPPYGHGDSDFEDSGDSGFEDSEDSD
ncbi:hypothetical protein CC2G_009930 [Coprinopsis cinerea AmutBmut pab1-1]|nr:hypothetical protein CC2G_009930 [Coprinopsis cinerea AmutBmut pab1-1]